MNELRRAPRQIEILLVEDSPSDRLLTVAALEELRILNALHTVDNGVDALAFLRREGRFSSAPRPDIVLLDLNLPQTDGREVLARLKSDPQLRHIPVIVLTTSQSDEDVVRTYALHANSYIQKPVDLEQFGAAVRSLGHYWFEVVTLADQGALERVRSTTTQPSAKKSGDNPLRVLLVEDSDSDALLLRESLGAHRGRFELTRVATLKEARAVLDANAFDVIVADLGLPDSQGLETCREVRLAARGAPVVALTGADDDELGLAALQNGAQDYLLKSEHRGRALARAIRYAVDRQTIQQHVLQSQRLEAIGRLANGVAHDFNNLLTVVQGNASLLKAADDAEKTELATEILAAAARGAALTRQLLAFSKKRVLEAVPLNVNELVDATGGMLRRLLGDTRVELQLADSLPSVNADEALLSQVVLNLALNARDAMPQGGKMTIKTHSAILTPDAALRVPGVFSGQFVYLSVSDVGTGIEPAILDRIWEPFFTTKPVGKGTGLGLAMVYGVVHQHGGFVRVSSRVGVGTTFEVALPAIADTAASEPVAPLAPVDVVSVRKRILLVDDEPGVRLIAARILRSQGHDVIDVDSGEAALRMWETAGGNFDVVVTDVVMPDGMNGCELATALRRRRDDLRVVFISGYPEDVDAQSLCAGMSFLAKPFSVADLLAIVA